ncbi:hypothetical protein HY488_00350 [Candidatus Woesearchaeota archaeon]|nr:hypothetical protein [Candidatus Woesearchaeota archaeon]
MGKADVILEQIIKTYDLPQPLQARVFRMASYHVEREGLHTFNEVYHYVAGLVERCQERWDAKYDLRLDHFVQDDDSKSMLINILTYERDPAQEDASLAYEKRVSINEAIAGLQPYLSEAEHTLLLKLAKNVPEESLAGSIDEVIEHASKIKERLGVLAQLQQEERRLAHPERPIVYVNLDSQKPSIQFGRRDYDGNPLAFYQRHRELYGGMSQNELHHFDPGLYRALEKHHQLDHAIPIKHEYPQHPADPYSPIIQAAEVAIPIRRKPAILPGSAILSPEKIRSVLESRDHCRGNSRLAAIQLSLPRMLIHNIWKKSGLI